MGLPEQIGGEGNWDHRCTWVRDASLSVRALTDLGFAEEALDHLEGYRGSAPVRAGNAATDQIQLDIYGEAANALAQAEDIGALGGWRAFSGLLDWLADHWGRLDEGIRETRGGRQDFTYSRLMTWVAFDRGIRFVAANSRPADAARWTAARDDAFRQITGRGWNPKRRAFVQHYDTDVLDASLLVSGSLVHRDGTTSPLACGSELSRRFLPRARTRNYGQQ